MPKKPRSEKENNEIRENIIKLALDIIQDEGFEGFSMRKLSKRMGFSVVTLYRFYDSKDLIYLDVLTNGFRLLYRNCKTACDAFDNPEEKLKALIQAYLAFGIEHANFYNLMLIWHVPKYQDYVGTPMEAAAKQELIESQKVLLLTKNAVKEMAETLGPVTDEEIESVIVFFWSTLHGYVAGVNSSVLEYIADSPLSQQEMIVENLFKLMTSIKTEIADRNKN